MATATNHPNEKIAQTIWTAFILAFFVIQAIIWTIAISVTANDQSHAVVSGYDQQALHWDQVKQAYSDSERLGWTARLSVSDSADLFSNRKFQLKLFDRNEQPVKNASIELKAFHRGAAADVQLIELSQNEPGIYLGIINVVRSGKWCFEGTAKLDGKTFYIQQTNEINGGKGL